MSVVQALELALTKARECEARTPKIGTKLPVRPDRPRIVEPVTPVMDGKPKPGGTKTVLKPAPPKYDLSLLRTSLIEVAESIARKGMIAGPWKSKRYKTWAYQVARENHPASIGKLLSELEANLSDRCNVRLAWKNRRPGWSKECNSAFTLHELAGLIVEFGNVFTQ